MNEIRKVIKFYLTEIEDKKKPPLLFVKFNKTFLKYFADQMKDNFPGRRRNLPFGFGTGGVGSTVNLNWTTADVDWSTSAFTDNTAVGTVTVNTAGTNATFGGSVGTY